MFQNNFRGHVILVWINLSKTFWISKSQGNVMVHSLIYHLDLWTGFVKHNDITVQKSRWCTGWGNSWWNDIVYQMVSKTCWISEHNLLVSHIDSLAMCCTFGLARAVLFSDCVGIWLSFVLRSARTQFTDSNYPRVTRSPLSLLFVQKTSRCA